MYDVAVQVKGASASKTEKDVADSLQRLAQNLQRIEDALKNLEENMRTIENKITKGNPGASQPIKLPKNNNHMNPNRIGPVDQNATSSFRESNGGISKDSSNIADCQQHDYDRCYQFGPDFGRVIELDDGIADAEYLDPFSYDPDFFLGE